MKTVIIKILKYLWLAVDKKKLLKWGKDFVNDTFKKKLNRTDIAAVGLGVTSLTMVADNAMEVEAVDAKVDKIEEVMTIDTTGVVTINGVEFIN